MLVITAFCIDEREKVIAQPKMRQKYVSLHSSESRGGGLGTNVCLRWQKSTSSQYFQQFNLRKYLLSSPDMSYSFNRSYFLEVYTSFTFIQS